MPKENEYRIASADPSSTDMLRALRRLHQLAGEIRAALERNDMEIVRRAASLLAPALVQCRLLSAEAISEQGEATRLIAETRQLLDLCAERLMLERDQLAHKLKCVRRGRKTLVAVRARPVHPKSRISIHG